MSYATLRSGDDPQMRHCNETPSESPCRDCEFRAEDKNAHPDCINCLKRDVFQTRPMNMDLKPDPELKPPAAYRTPVYRKFTPKPETIPVTAKCTVPGCNKPARYRFFKDIWTDYLCHNCYLRMFRRYRRNGTIYDREGKL